MTLDQLLTEHASASDLRDYLDRHEGEEKRSALLTLAEFHNPAAYGVLRPYLQTGYRHQALIAMGALDYDATMDLVFGILRKENQPHQRDDTIDTLSCVFFDTIDTLGDEPFLQKLATYTPLEDDLRRAIYSAVKKALPYTEIPHQNYSAYLQRASANLALTPESSS